jgi:hypothetical protein
MDNTSPIDSAALYYQLCLAADEYTSFRHSMLVSPTGGSPATIEAALQRSDRIVALLRQLRERQAVAFVTAYTMPVPPTQPPPGAKAPTPPPQAQPLGPRYSWKCAGCGTEFATPTPARPAECPNCRARFA